MADSWLTDGNCKERRRKSYCKKPCTLAKRNLENLIYNAVSGTAMGKILDSISKKY